MTDDMPVVYLPASVMPSGPFPPDAPYACGIIEIIAHKFSTGDGLNIEQRKKMVIPFPKSSLLFKENGFILQI
ncbi:MAG: hypothetical protein P8184_19660 [Calditrichia bacterium]